MKYRNCCIQDIASVKGGKRLPKGVSLSKEKNSHPYIKVRNLNNSRKIELDIDYEYVDELTHKKIAKYIVGKGDIVLSIVGTIGLVSIVGDSLDGANLTENCVKLTDFKGVDSYFLYYYLKSQLGQTEIKKNTVGAVQAKLPIKNINSMNLKLPDLDSQIKISSILNSIDEKIEINNKINKNLAV